MAAPVLRSLEFTVADIEPCVELLVGLMGLELLGRTRHPVLDAEVAQVRSGEMTITLLCPTETGHGRPLPEPTPRMSQLTFSLPSTAEIAASRLRLSEGGAAVIERDASLHFVDAQMVKGMFGADAAMVFTLDDGGGVPAAGDPAEASAAPAP